MEYWYSLIARLSVRPAAEGLDPLRPAGVRLGKRQTEDADGLAEPPAGADRDDSAAGYQVDLLHGRLDARDLRRERNFQMVLDHGVEAAELFLIIVGVDDGLLDQRVQIIRVRHAGSLPRRPPAGVALLGRPR
jgi:hypothetical protein